MQPQRLDLSLQLGAHGAFADDDQQSIRVGREGFGKRAEQGVKALGVHQTAYGTEHLMSIRRNAQLLARLITWQQLLLECMRVEHAAQGDHRQLEIGRNGVCEGLRDSTECQLLAGKLAKQPDIFALQAG